jgi:hypothetical protein
VATKRRRDIFGGADQDGTPHIAVGLAIEKGGGAVGDLLVEADFIGGLKKRQGVQVVIFVVNHEEAFDAGMHVNPLTYFIAPWSPRQIRRHIDKGYSVMLRR